MAGISDSLLSDNVKAFEEALSSLESELGPLMKKGIKEIGKDLENDPLLGAKFQVSQAYLVYSLFYAYLKMTGEDVEGHPLMKQLGYVQNYLTKIENLEASKEKPELVVNVPAAERFIRSALNEVKEKGEQSSADKDDKKSSPGKDGKGSKSSPGKRKRGNGKNDQTKPAKQSPAKRSDLPSTHRSTPQPSQSHSAWKNAEGKSAAEKAKAFLKQTKK